MAVFLALGLGILVGTTVLDDSLVGSLRGRFERLQQQTSDLREQLDAALGRGTQAERFAADVQPFLLKNRLVAEPMVVVTVDGTEGAALDEALAALDLAGARVVTVITAQQAMAAESASDAQELAGILGMPASATPEELMAGAADALAGRLASSPVRPVDSGEDLLGQLLNAGFVVAPGLSDGDLADVGGPGQEIVVVGGGTPASLAASEGFLVPLVSNLVNREMITAAAEGSDPASTFVASATEAADSGSLVTADGLDQPVGGSALVLGIDQVLLTGEGGAFGVGDQASQPLPPPPA